MVQQWLTIFAIVLGIFIYMVCTVILMMPYHFRWWKPALGGLMLAVGFATEIFVLINWFR